MKSTPSTGRVLICDDTERQYQKVKKFFNQQGIQCAPQVSTLEDARSSIRKSHKEREWFSLVLIDLDLSRSPETWNGVQVYQALRNEFPDESYVIYTRSPTDRFRNDINRLAFRDVELVLLDDDVLSERKMNLALAKVVTTVSTDHVFLVSGRNSPKNAKIEKLLSTGLGLTVVNFDMARERVQKRPEYIFEIVLAGIEMSHATVVLFTDDEVVRLRSKLRSKSDPEEVKRARPNVYIEAGYAMGLRPKRTVFLEWPDDTKGFEGPSDFAGIHVLRYTDNPSGRKQLQRRLESARCALKPAPTFANMKL